MMSGPLSLSFEPTRIDELVRDIVVDLTLSSELAQSPISVRAVAAEVSCDAARLEIVLMNLLDNALKYGAGKPVEVDVARVDDRVRISVRDHGIGIAKCDHARIFKRFERAVPIRNHGGFGIGLWISREVVEAHGGRISVSSEPNEGALFAVELPA